MRFRHIHAMAPMQRMDVLEAQFPPGGRTELFLQCAPGEYERLFYNVPGHRTRQWTSMLTDDDRHGWDEYAARTRKHQEHEQAQLAVLRPALSKAMEAAPIAVDELLELPRLLGDPVEEMGVRLYFLKEGLSDYGLIPGRSRVHVTEKIYPVDILVEKLVMMQRWGWAPFVALHEIAYGERRSNATATAARVFSADWDQKKDQSPPEELLRKYPPDLFVRSGGGYHAYWIIPEEERAALSLTEWRRVGLALARCLNSDVETVLGSQIMRLPGSFHLKNPAEPKRVRAIARREDGIVRANVAQALITTFRLVLRDEDTLTLHAPTQTIDVDPEDHEALARVLGAINAQGLAPRQDGRGWTFYCPCHETATFIPPDLEDGDEQLYVPRKQSTPSGILRVNADRSLALFCGSRVTCGAGPRDILGALGLSKELVWLESGGFLKSDYGQRYKAARIADGTWNTGDRPDAPQRDEQRAETLRRAAETRTRTKTLNAMHKHANKGEL